MSGSVIRKTGRRPWNRLACQAIRQIRLLVGGRHKFRLEQSRLMRSAIRSFQLRDEQAIIFSCTSKPNRLLLPLFWPVALLRRDTLISLRRYGRESEK